MLGIVAAGALGSAAWLLPQAETGALRRSWHGAALGAEVHITLYHPDRRLADAALDLCRREIDRLEDEFSLFRWDSALSRLNRDGRLAAPTLDMRRLIERSLHFGAATGGGFDVTIQPLWLLIAEHAARHPDDARGPDAHAVAAALARVDYRNLDVSARSVALAKPDMAVTLNGIAQGYITDRIADLLHDLGFDHVLVDAGELRALAGHPDGRPWQIALRHPPRPDRLMALSAGALATSSGRGTPLSRDGCINHLLDPVTGASPHPDRTVSVLAARATDADALATALCLVPRQDMARLLRTVADAVAVVTEPDGTSAVIADRSAASGSTPIAMG
jgi:thiamine biosynthesis lipoprotein